MRKLFAIALIASTVNAFAQVEMTYNAGAQFQTVIELQGKPAAEIYKTAYKWINITYKNPQAVLSGQIENELITGNGAGDVMMPGLIAVSNPYKYIFRIDVKEGKLRITVDNMVVVTKSGNFAVETYVFKSDGSKRSNSQARGIESDITGDMNSLFNSLAAYLLAPPEKKDDW